MHKPRKPTYYDSAAWHVLATACKERDGHRCRQCKRRRRGMILHAHHIIPRSAGGPDTLDNLATLCRRCHETVHGRRIPRRRRKRT